MEEQNQTDPLAVFPEVQNSIVLQAQLFNFFSFSCAIAVTSTGMLHSDPH